MFTTQILNEFMLKGEGNVVKTTVSLHQQILDDEWFCTGNIDTQFIKHRLPIYAAADALILTMLNFKEE